MTTDLKLPVDELARLGVLDTEWLSAEDIALLAFPTLARRSAVKNADPAEVDMQFGRREEFMRHVVAGVDGGLLTARRSKRLFAGRAGDALAFYVDVQHIQRESFFAWLPQVLLSLLPGDSLLWRWVSPTEVLQPITRQRQDEWSRILDDGIAAFRRGHHRDPSWQELWDWIALNSTPERRVTEITHYGERSLSCSDAGSPLGREAFAKRYNRTLTGR